MSWISKLLGGSLGNIVGEVGNVVDKFHLSGEEKQKFMLEMEALVQKRDSEIENTMRTELKAKQDILVAELIQGDNYTKRARPTVVYAGLGFIVFNYCLIPMLGLVFNGVSFPALSLPPEFWYGWSGIVATWSVGRSMEKRGASNKVSRAITGVSATSKLIVDDDEVKG